jgi:potassium/hydrogen antiporter
VHKRSVLRFHDGIAWLMQIAMFLTLGLLVFPSQLVPVAPVGLLLALFLALVARPLSVIVVLVWFRRSLREMLMVAWAGLRGAVPIVLATFPLLAGVPGANAIFNVIFFIVVISVLLQGMSVSWVSHWLGVNADEARQPTQQFFLPDVRLTSRMVEAIVPAGTRAVGQTLIDLGLPRGVLVVHIQREDEPIIPSGGTILMPDDHLLILVTPDAFPALRTLEQRYGVRLIVPEGNAVGVPLEAQP